jgi:hypothetical protein
MSVTVTVNSAWQDRQRREQLVQLVADLLRPGSDAKIVIEWDGAAQRGKIAAE